MPAVSGSLVMYYVFKLRIIQMDFSFRCLETVHTNHNHKFMSIRKNIHCIIPSNGNISHRAILLSYTNNSSHDINYNRILLGHKGVLFILFDFS